MIQLDPVLWLWTPKGVGVAHLATWASPEQSIYWTVFITDGEHAGEIYTFENEQVRAHWNLTLGRAAPSAPPQRSRRRSQRAVARETARGSRRPGRGDD